MKSGDKTDLAQGGMRRRDVLRSGLLVGAGIAAGDLFTASQSSAQTVTLRLGSDSPIGAPHTVGLVHIKQEVEAKTGGRIKVTVFPDGQLGNPEATMNAIKAGTLDGTFTDVGIFSTAVPEVDLFNLPFLFRDIPHALRAAQGAVGQKIKLRSKMEDAYNCEVLGLGTDGIRNMFNGKRPIKTPDDLKGLKMRIQSSQIQQATYEAFGALPTPISFGELYGALQNGVVDGAEQSVVDMVELKFYQVTKYYTITQHIVLVDVLVFSKATMAKLAPADQAIVREAGKTGCELQIKALLAADDVALKELQSKGLQVFQMADPKAFSAKVESVYALGARRVGGAAIIEEARNSP